MRSAPRWIMPGACLKMIRRHKPRRSALLWASVWLLVCALPFAALPPLLATLPLRGAMAGLWLLIWVLCPVLAAIASFFAAYAGVPAALAWLFAPLGYLLLPLWGIRPEWAILLAACAIGILFGVTAEQWTRKRRRQR